MLIICIYKINDLISFDKVFFAKMAKLLAILMFLKFSIFYLFFKLEFNEQITNIMLFLNPTDLTRVWYEDALYALPYAMAQHYLLNKTKFSENKVILILSPFFITTSLWFGMGHLYQGLIGLVAMVMPLISWKIIRKYGVLTMFLIHIYFDSLSFIYMKIFKVL